MRPIPTSAAHQQRSKTAASVCQACGIPLKGRQRRWCSPGCRQTLHACLERRTGLLKALNTRYGVFYFTDSVLILDLLTRHTDAIYSYMYSRRLQTTPAKDFSRMSNQLGNRWWAEKRRTQKFYRASEHILDLAHQHSDTAKVRPLVTRKPKQISGALRQLKLSPADLGKADVQAVIRRAYRRQAMVHHPDKGGTAHLFREIHAAYRHLNTWAKNPIYQYSQGIPGKWLYDGRRNYWVQPK